MMRFPLVSVRGVCVSLIAAGMVVGVVQGAAEAESISPMGQQLAQKAQENDEITLLEFETLHYMVRVFRQENSTFLNVYNKETGFTDLNSVPAYLINPEEDAGDWRTYVNQRGDLEYRAGINPAGDTALEIRIAGGPPAQPEYGFNATYSFPHIYLGENLESALTELKDSGWSVNATEAAQIQLTRNQLALALKFDPETKIIIYTQLVDAL